MTDSGVIPRPEDRANCETCLDSGYIEVEDCTCGVGPDWHPPHRHEPMCGFEPCPNGCDLPP